MSRLDVSILESKEFTKYAKFSHEKNAKELIQKPKEELEKIIVECEVQEVQTRFDKVANENFQKAKSIVDDFNGAERDTVNPIKAKKKLALLALKSLRDNP